MEYIFLKEESIAFDGVNPTFFKVGDKIEESTVNKISRTLLAYYLKHKILGTKDMEVKSLNPVIENKAITNIDNKSTEDLSIGELKKMLFDKGINFDNRLGKEKLIKLLEENK